MGSLQEERILVKSLLAEAVTLLCKSRLTYRSEFSVEGLLGITLDNEDVFLVNINEIVRLEGSQPAPSVSVSSQVYEAGDHVLVQESEACKIKDEVADQATESPTSKQDCSETVIELSDSEDHQEAVGTASFYDANTQPMAIGGAVPLHIYPHGSHIKHEAGANAPRLSSSMKYDISSPPVSAYGLMQPMYSITPSHLIGGAVSSTQRLSDGVIQSPGKNKTPNNVRKRKIPKKTASTAPPLNKDLKDDPDNARMAVYRAEKYFCKECNVEFRSRCNFLSHDKAVHQKILPFKCAICGKAFRFKHVYQAHMNKHYGRRFYCDICGASFSYPNTLQAHKKEKHANEVVT